MTDNIKKPQIDFHRESIPMAASKAHVPGGVTHSELARWLSLYKALGCVGGRAYARVAPLPLG